MSVFNPTEESELVLVNMMEGRALSSYAFLARTAFYRLKRPQIDVRYCRISREVC